MKSFLFFISLLVFIVSAKAQTVRDPIADFLSLPIKDRLSDASLVVELQIAKMDLLGDGSSVIFVGHHKMWNGDGRTIYFSAYHFFDGVFRRLLEANEDVAIEFYEGKVGCVFVGFLSEKKSHGLLIANPIYRNLPGDPGILLPIEKYSSRRFYRIINGKLVVEELGPLNLANSTDKKFYDRYFGEKRNSRKITFEELSASQLRERGYKLPDWSREK